MGSILEDSAEMKGNVLALTDQVVMPVSAVLAAIKEHGDKRVGQDDPVVITQASLLKQLPIESSSMEVVIFLLKTQELPAQELFEEILKVLKPGGAITFQLSHLATENRDEMVSTLVRRLLMAGFFDAKINSKPLLTGEDVASVIVKANKPSWDTGSSFSLKKPAKSLPKLQIDDDMDLIDEDSLLTEEDLKKPQLPVVGDCEVGSTRKACKNCICGRAEGTQKVEKLLTADLIDNAQSGGCGSCTLGDAFRCATCPFKGLPPGPLPFKPGQKVSLSSDFLQDI